MVALLIEETWEDLNLLPEGKRSLQGRHTVEYNMSVKKKGTCICTLTERTQGHSNEAENPTFRITQGMVWCYTHVNLSH